MKKSTALLLVLCLCLSICALVGCNRVDAGKLSEIAGTYQLTKYEITNMYDSKNNTIPEEERVTRDLIKESGMRIFVVIPTSGPAYYAYSDNETEWYCIETHPKYEYETEQQEDGTSVTTDLIGRITLDGNSGFESSFYVQAKSKTLSDNKSAWRSSFRGILSGKTYYIGNKAKIDITYKRVSNDTTLDTVNRSIGKTLTPTPYELNPMLLSKSFTGSQIGDVETSPLYDYYFFDVAAGTVKHCYAERKANPEKMEETLTFSYDAATGTYRIGDTVFTNNSNSYDFSLANEDYTYFVNSFSDSEEEARANFDVLISEYVEYLESLPRPVE
ncbi:MAG: hypothetical protein MJ082_00590 [Clostridia bacterium]|nr:hypothetical protein [Clostridia bacterium]